MKLHAGAVSGQKRGSDRAMLRGRCRGRTSRLCGEPPRPRSASQSPAFETLNALYHSNHEFVSLIQRIEGGVAEGAQGYRDWLVENDESWERWDIKLNQARSIEGDRVLVDGRRPAWSRTAPGAPSLKKSALSGSHR